jgi:hypothetical protein
MTLEARVAALERAAAERRAQDAVLDTLLRYCRSIDLGANDDWVDCFTHDASFDVRSHISGFAGVSRVGHDELALFAARHSAPPEVFHKHVYLMPEIHIDGRTATAAGYFMHLVDVAGGVLVRSYGRYIDRLTKCDDQRWRLAQRVAEVEATSQIPQQVGAETPPARTPAP